MKDRNTHRFVTAVLAMSLVGPAVAATGMLQINGRISAATCQVNGAVPDAGAVDMQVELLPVSASALRKTGDRSDARYYDVVVGGAGDITCTDGLLASMYVEPTSPAIDAASGRLNNDDRARHARNVQVVIKNAEGSEIDLRNSANTQQVEIVGNTATLRYAAEYVATDEASSGRVSTRVQYSMVYN